MILFTLLVWLLTPTSAEATACSFSGSHGSGTFTCADTGNVITNGTNFENTINPGVSGIVCGDTVILPAGVTHQITAGIDTGVASFFARFDCTPPTVVTIKSSGLASLPSGTRVTYASIPNMATLVGSSSDPTLEYQPHVGGWTWQGIVFTTANLHPLSHAPDIVRGAYTDAMEDQIHDITYDRVIIRPYEESLADPDSIGWRSASRGLGFEGINMTLKDSYVGGFCCLTANGIEISESIGVGTVSGYGPYTITNNLIEAYGWNIFTGGGSSAPTNTTTISSVTNTSAVFSDTTGLSVGMVVRFYHTTPLVNDTDPGPNKCREGVGGAVHYSAAKVTDITGSTVTWTWLCNSGGTMCPGPTENPDSPGQAGWRTFPRLNHFTVTRNTLNKRQVWYSGSGQGKSFWEMKEGSNVLFEGNTLTGPIDAIGHASPAINDSFATPQNPTNPWAESRDNIFRSNLMYGLSEVFPGTYNAYCVVDPSTAAINVTFTNNLLFSKSSRQAFFSSIQYMHNHVITHNTVTGIDTNRITKDSNCCVSNDVIFRDNIVTGGSNYFQPITSFSNLVTDHNIVIDNFGSGCVANRDAGHCNGWAPAATDHVISSDTDVGYTNVTDGNAIDTFGVGGNYHSYALTSGSIGHLAASDGKDIGVDFTQLDAALSGSTPEGTTTISGSGTFTGRWGIQ